MLVQLLANPRSGEALISGRCTMELLDLLIEADAEHIDCCADLTDLESALARRLGELDARDDLPPALEDKIAQVKLAREFGRIRPH
jgi:hypothetical protein